MKDRVQGAVTAGVALVGAGVMAAVPAVQQAPEVLRSVHADVQLAAVEDRYTGSVPELFALSAQRSVTGLVSTPVGLATAAIALAQGGPDQTAAAYDILKEIVDGPMWASRSGDLCVRRSSFVADRGRRVQRPDAARVR